MDLGLAGRTALVTGASRGIGLAVVEALIAEGVRVVGAARRPSAELIAAGAHPVAVDLRDPDGPAALVEAAVTHLGGLDVVVNNAGGGDLTLDGFADLDDATWTQTFDLNLFAAIRTTRAALPSLLERQGVVLNVSSIGAWKPEGPPLAYNVAKAALKAFGRGLATELGPAGVRVLTVTPGPTRTAMWGLMAELTGLPEQAILAGLPEQMGIVTGRVTEPEEVAALITFLASPRAGNITGSDHLVDGGAIRSA
ncbi:MAG: SDR family oxidoreductase [Propionibacteriaceae bacterium]|nr:SDR family oxidoreductase [Propionibacteriaceae bacterium]